MLRMIALLVLLQAFARPVAAAEPPTAPLSDEERKRAVELFSAGKHHYDLAEYEQAIDALKEAYRLTQAPELLFNIAQAFRLWKHCSQAQEFYRSYLRNDPDTAKRAMVEALVAELADCAAQEQAAPPTAPALPPATHAAVEEPARSKLPLGIAVGGGVVALLGLGLMLWAEADYGRVAATGCAPRCDPATYRDAQLRQTAGRVSLGLGAAVALVAAAVQLFWVGAQTEAPVAGVVRLGPLGLSGSF